MIRTTILGLLILTLAIATIPALAADAQSPMQQLNQGTPIDQIQCDDGKVLMKSTGERPACAYGDTVPKLLDRGWLVISNNTQTSLMESPGLESKKQHTGESKTDNTRHLHGTYHLPQVDTKVGFSSLNITKDQPLEITYTDTFTAPPTGFERKFTSVVIYVPSQITVEFDIVYENSTLDDPSQRFYYLSDRAWGLNFYQFEEVGKMHNNTATLTLNEDLNKDKDFLSIAYGQGIIDYYLLEQIGDVVTLTKQDWSDVYDVGDYFASYEQEYIEAQRQARGQPDPSDQMNKYIERKTWPMLADFLREQHKQGFHLDWMTTGEFSDEFIEDFTRAYPDLIVQSGGAAGTVPVLAFALTTPGEADFQDVGPVGDVLDITTLESYRIHPDITKEMLARESNEPALTAEFGVAYDELNLIGFGYEEHIRGEYVEFLEELEITVFGTRGNTIEMSIHSSQKDKLGEIRKQLKLMYPNVDIVLSISPGLAYDDAILKSSTANTVSMGKNHTENNDYPYHAALIKT